MEFMVQDSERRVGGAGFGAERASHPKACSVKGSGLARGSFFRVQNIGLRVPGSECRVQGSVFRM